MNSIRRVTRSIERIGFAASKVILVLMMVIITANTVGRYVFNSPLPAVISLTELYLMIGVVFLSAAAVQRNGENVSVDLFEDRLPDSIRHLIALTTRAAVLVILLLIVTESAGLAMERLQTGASTTGSLPLPTGPSWGMVTVGLGILCMVIVDQALTNVRFLYEYVTGSETGANPRDSDAASRGDQR